jgi:hypothetical protein
MKQFLAAVAILLLLIGVGMYAAGWLKFDREPGRATIEINTEKLEESAEDVAEGSRELVNQAADSVEQATNEPAEVTVDDADGVDRTAEESPSPPGTLR